MANQPNNNLKSQNTSNGLEHKKKMDRYQIDHKMAQFTIMMAIFIDVLGYSMILPLLPSIAQGAFGASNFTIGFLIASNALAAFVFAPIWGKLSDKFGRKPFLIVSQMGTLTAFIILGFSDSLNMVFLSRIVDGIFGGQIPIIRAYIIDITDSKTRSAEMGKITGAMAFGMIFGPAIGGLLGVLNWRYPVYVACFLSIFTIIFTFRYLQESMPKQRIQDARQRKEAFKAQNRGKPRQVLTKIVIYRLIELFLVIFAFIMINSSFPLVLTLRYGVNVAMIGLFASIAGIMMMITGGLLIKPLIKKYGEKAMILVALIISFALFLIYPFLFEFWWIYVFIFPYIFAHMFTRSILMTNLAEAVDEDNQGIVSGYAVNMMSIAQITAPLLAYWYLELWIVSIMGMQFDSYFLIGITCALTTVLLFFLLIYDMKKHPEVFSKETLETEDIRI
ncbi:MAG: MFS transporter [Promethearchaeota archaeon]|nr:MAG: MFS transporter [Candidatus Lokiarchaeota archaeon]